MKYRGNLVESEMVTGSGDRRPPAGKGGLRGGEVATRDDIMRTKADKTKTPPSGGKGKVGTLPGKAMTGRGSKKRMKMKMTAREAAAILGKRG